MQINLDIESARYILQSFNKKKIKNKRTKEIIDILSAQLRHYDCPLFPFEAVELNEIILSYLDIDDVLSLLQVNKQMRKIDKNDNFWRRRVLSDFGFDPLPYLIDMNCKSCYSEFVSSELSSSFLAITRGYISLLRKDEKIFRNSAYMGSRSIVVSCIITAIKRGHIDVIKLFAEWKIIHYVLSDVNLLKTISNNISIVKFLIGNKSEFPSDEFDTDDFESGLICSFVTNHEKRIDKTGKLDENMIIKLKILLEELNPKVAVPCVLQALDSHISRFPKYISQILANIFTEKQLLTLDVQDISEILLPSNNYAGVIIKFIIKNIKHINLLDIAIRSNNYYAVESLLEQMVIEDRIKYVIDAVKIGNKVLLRSLNKTIAGMGSDVINNVLIPLANIDDIWNYLPSNHKFNESSLNLLDNSYLHIIMRRRGMKMMPRADLIQALLKTD